MSKTIIELDPQEALEFTNWRMNQDLFNQLMNIGVFGVRNGHAELHFDADGNLCDASLHFKVFRRKVVHSLTVIKQST